jgi:hypothetical protein
MQASLESIPRGGSEMINWNAIAIPIRGRGVDW